MKYVIIFMLGACTIHGQDYFNETYDSEKIKHLVIDNFQGDIIVQRSNTEKISVIAVQEGQNKKQTLTLKKYMQEELVYLYIDHPCRQDFGAFDPDHPFKYSRSWNDCEWNNDENAFPTLSFTIQIPDGVDIYVATVMDSKIEIERVKGNIYASNVNGPISMTGVQSVKNGTTVNGDINIYYDVNPDISGFFSTINGEINLNVPKDASITTKFKSQMGEMFTDLDAIQIMDKKQASGIIKAGENFKIEEYSHAKIGQGEITMTIETFNGNAYLRKNK